MIDDCWFCYWFCVLFVVVGYVVVVGNGWCGVVCFVLECGCDWGVGGDVLC